jgi:Uma2 family endonuclease
MGMPAAKSPWTTDLLDALPESSERFEIIDGELFVTPSPGFAHQGVVLRLASRLLEYTTRIGGFETVISPSDVWRGDQQLNRVQPDIYVVRRGPDGALPPYPFHLRELVLAIEVASPGRPFLDYQVKRDLYREEGVAEYWVLNLEERNLSRWHGRDDPGDVVRDQIDWRPSDAAEPFTLDLPAFFDTALR